jgi:hypothetical protein
MESILLGILTTILGIVGTLTAVWLKYYLDKRAKSQECVVQRTVNEDTEILDRLDELKSEIGADRISIFSFHNGGEYYSGRSMQKLSCSYEVVQPGIARHQMKMQNVPVSACLTTIKHMIEEKEFFCYDVDRDFPESACKSYLIEYGVKSTYQYAIFDLNRRAIGILRADFIAEKERINSKQADIMRFTAIKLSGYLIGQKH